MPMSWKSDTAATPTITPMDDATRLMRMTSEKIRKVVSTGVMPMTFMMPYSLISRKMKIEKAQAMPEETTMNTMMMTMPMDR